MRSYLDLPPAMATAASSNVSCLRFLGLWFVLVLFLLCDNLRALTGRQLVGGYFLRRVYGVRAGACCPSVGVGREGGGRGLDQAGWRLYICVSCCICRHAANCSVWNRLCQPFQNFLLPEILHLCCFVTVDELVSTSIEVSQPGRADCVVLDWCGRHS